MSVTAGWYFNDITTRTFTTYRGKPSPYGWEGKQELAREILDVRHTAAGILHSEKYPLALSLERANKFLYSEEADFLGRLPTGTGEGEEGPRTYVANRFAQERKRVLTEYERLLREVPETGPETEGFLAARP